MAHNVYDSTDDHFLYYPPENYSDTQKNYLVTHYKTWSKNTTFDI